MTQISGRTSWEGTPIRNRALLLMPEAEFQTVRPLLSFQPFLHHATLHETGEELEFVHFPNQGLVSIVVATRSGKTVEVAIVGHEGFVGMAAVVGLRRSPDRAVVQVAGNGFRIRADALRTALSTSLRLQAILSRYAAIQGMQAAQLAACNRLHGVEQRLARWLLIMRDRTEQVSLQITHDSLATMLGTDRPSVSLAAGDLQRKGAIEYRRGVVAIVNHEILEGAACECYVVIQELTKGL
jgi:CRP-like cAMP-binding protein